MKKKIFFFVTFLTMFLSTLFYLQDIKLFETADNKIKDSFFTLRGEINTTGYVTIVNIDEKSLSAFGQWPWKRSVLAKIVQNLTKANAGIIGFDIFFPEKDAKNGDYDFAKAIANSPSILGYMFDFEKNISKNSLPNIPAVFIQKNFTKEFLPNAKGYISNIPILQNSAYSAGFVNMIPDGDGIVRYVPLLIKYKDSIYPSLAFEMYRLSQGASKITIEYSPAGIMDLSLDTNTTVKTDRFGRIFINYRGDRYKFKYLSALDVYNNDFNISDVQNRFVLIGTTSLGLFDLRATPFNNVYPGVEIHANVIDNLLKGDFIYKPDFVEVVDLLAIIVLLILNAYVIYRFGALLSFVFSLFLFVGYFYFTYFMFLKGLLINTVYPLSAIIVIYIVLTTVNYIFEHKKTLEIKKAFAKKVSPEVMEELIRNQNILKPKEKEITIYFSDIRGFTDLSEKINNPTKLINFLNRYFTPMTEIIVKNKGTVDKFIGDAIMAYWNAPQDVKDHADKAVSCAIEQIKLLKKLNSQTLKKFDIQLDIGIGINTGIATIGEMGSSGRADYTIIGDSVNLASRLEGLNKYYRSHIIISSYTKNKLTGNYIIRFLDTVYVKGKNRAVDIFEVLGFGEKNFDEYNYAIKLYKKAEFHKAKKIFEKLYSKEKEHIYQIYIQRCEEYIKNPENFEPVYRFTTK